VTVVNVQARNEVRIRGDHVAQFYTRINGRPRRPTI
jgi:hypothetical protein